jgi:hypothetical protein
MGQVDSVLPLVSEWPFGPPRYPIKKLFVLLQAGCLAGAYT